MNRLGPRLAGRISVVALSLGALACGEPDAERPDHASVEATPVEPVVAAPSDPQTGRPSPTEGGTVIGVGPWFVEVLGHSDGEVHAFLRGDDTPSPTEVDLGVRLTADDGHLHPVHLTWDPAEGRHRGRLHGRHAIPGPIEITMTHHGETHRGRSERLVVRASAPRPAQAQTRRPPAREPAEESPTAAAGTQEPPPPPPSGAASPRVATPTAPRIVRPEVTETTSPVPTQAPEAARVRPGRVRVVDRRARATGAARTRRQVAPGPVTVRPRE